MKRNIEKIVNWLAGGLFALFVVYCVFFVLTHGNIVRNRFTDSWWRIALADEYAKTGVFAKDPFFTDAPPFAQFDLMAFMNAKISRVSGISTKKILTGLTAVNAAIALLSVFFAGYLFNKRILAGCLCSIGWAVIYSKQGVIGLGLPFSAALALLFLLMALLWHGTGWERAGVCKAIALGILLGVIFDLHAFIGIAGCAVAGVTVISCWTRFKDGFTRFFHSELIKAILFGMAFLLVSWRWLFLHLSLRPVLGGINAHVTAGQGVDKEWIIKLILGMLVLLIVFVDQKRRRLINKEVVPYIVFGCVLLFFCLPPVNVFLARHTSSYMSGRVPWLFPFGAALVFAWDNVCEMFLKFKKINIAGMCVLLVSCVLVIPAVWQKGLFHLYMIRTSDYDRHPYEYLGAVPGDIRGKVVLSDPNTSYFLRGMAGAYVVTVPAGHASPAVDYKARDTIVYHALREGPSALGDVVIDAVFIDKHKNATASFANTTSEQIVNVWQTGGWEIGAENEDLIVLVPGKEMRFNIQ